MDKKDFALKKINYIICAISFFIIIIGFFLMTGSDTTIEKGFDPDIFSSRRINVAPTTCFLGFLLMVVGILYPEKSDNKTEKNKSKNTEGKSY